MDSKKVTASDTEEQFNPRQIGFITACGLIAAFAIATFDNQSMQSFQQKSGMSAFEKGLSSDSARPVTIGE